MPSVQQVENKIRRVEGFRVLIRHPDGRDVRGDRRAFPQYQYTRAMQNRASVTDWAVGRFGTSYPGFSVDVLKVDGSKAHGRTRLSTVRDTYLED